ALAVGSGVCVRSPGQGPVHQGDEPWQPAQDRLRQFPPIPPISPALDATEAVSDCQPLSCSTAKAISNSLPRPSSPPSRLVGTSVLYVRPPVEMVFDLRLNPVKGASTDPRPLVDASTTTSSRA